MTNEDEIKNLKIQFYAVSAVLAFLIIVLTAVIINIYVSVRKLKKNEEDEDEELETRERPPPPAVKPGFSFPKPNTSKNWQDDEAVNRRPNEQKEFSIPKSAVEKNWQGYPGEQDRNQAKRNFGNDFRNDENMSNYSYDGRHSGNAFRNPLSGNNEPERKFDYAEKRADRLPKPKGFNKPPSASGNNFNQDGNDNFGFKRDFQRNNNYY